MLTLVQNAVKMNVMTAFASAVASSYSLEETTHTMAGTYRAGLAMLGILVLTACGSSQDQTAEDPEDQTAAVDQENDADSSEEQGPKDVTLQLDDAQQTISYPMQGHDGEITMGIFAPRSEEHTSELQSRGHL